MEFRFLLIGLFLWAFCSGILRLFFYLKNKQQIADMKLGVVLMLASTTFAYGTKYWLQSLGVEDLIIFDWLFLVSLTVFLGGMVNYWSVKSFLEELNDFFYSKKEQTERKEVLDAIEQKSVAHFVMATLEEPKERLIICWHTVYFHYWIDELIDNVPAKIVGQNWYEIFPSKPKWKNLHAECVKQKIEFSSTCDYWKVADRYLEWSITPIDGNKLLFSFIDVTESKKQQLDLKRRNNELIQLGLKKLEEK